MAEENIDTIKILIVDDHPIVRKGLRMLIEDEEDMVVCAESGNANEAIRLIGDFEPSIVLSDITLEKNTNGLELISAMKQRYPGIPAIVITMHEESLYAERAIMAGAAGYVMKSELEDTIVSAIRRVLRGELYLREKTSLNIVSKLLHNTSEKADSPVDRLTDREFQVFRLLGSGLGTRKIAKKLNISVNTVETHRRHIRKKLNLIDADELVSYAIRWEIDSKK